jgi:hypothetical protein
MIQAECAASCRCDAGPAVQDNQGPIVIVCRQDGTVIAALLRPESEDALVVLKRSLEIADQQMYGAQRGSLWQSEVWRSHSVWSGSGCCVHDYLSYLRVLDCVQQRSVIPHAIEH